MYILDMQNIFLKFNATFWLGNCQFSIVFFVSYIFSTFSTALRSELLGIVLQKPKI